MDVAFNICPNPECWKLALSSTAGFQRRNFDIKIRCNFVGPVNASRKWLRNCRHSWHACETHGLHYSNNDCEKHPLKYKPLSNKRHKSEETGKIGIQGSPTTRHSSRVLLGEPNRARNGKPRTWPWQLPTSQTICSWANLDGKISLNCEA